MDNALTLLEIAGSCLYGGKPPCSCACPLDFDVRDFMGKIQSGFFTAAYKVFKNAAVFPETVCRICGEPCKNSCVRRELDASVSIKTLEEAVCGFVKNKDNKQYYIPPKNKEIMIVGGGLTGLTCAVKLSQRGYRVSLFEKTGRLCGWFGDTDEFERVAALDYLSITLNTDIETLDGYSFDAALVAVGEGKLKAPGDNVLIAARHEEPLLCIREGTELSYEIESVVKVGSVKHVRGIYGSCEFKTNIQGIAPVNRVEPESKDGYNQDEAKREGERCLKCDCTSCMDSCDMLTFYRKNPKKVFLDVGNTLNKTQISTKTALRQILSCTECGLCEPSCPAGVDFKRLFVESRRIMHKSGTLPVTLHDFWIRDMVFSNGDKAALTLSPPGNDKPKYVFFPGCQLGASDPLYVTKSYALLCEAFPGDVGIMLGCCGAPAHWAGREELFIKVTDEIKGKWEKLPLMITACPACTFMLTAAGISVMSLWDILAEMPLCTAAAPDKTLAVFDPCTSKESPKTQESIRTVLKKLGITFEELSSKCEKARCCGYGGLIYSVSPELAGKIAEKNVSLGQADYVTYCVNCRDSFSLKNKTAYHVLDLLLFCDESRGRRKAPGLTRRRANRIRLKKTLLKEIIDVDYDVPQDVHHKISLSITRELSHKLDRELILEDNIKKAVYCAETNGSKVFDPDTGYFICHLLQGYITYWVVYKPVEEGVYKVQNAYCHRMVIEEQKNE